MPEGPVDLCPNSTEAQLCDASADLKWMYQPGPESDSRELDSLTGTLTRRDILGDLEARLASAGANSVAALFIDIDELKSVNDAYGHAIGDELISRVAARVAAAIGPCDALGRLGGDEFLVLSASPTEGLATGLADRILTACKEPMSIDGIELQPRASIGVALTRPGTTADELVADADMAMYEAKRRRTGIAMASDSSRLRMRRSIAVNTGLGRAMESGEIGFAYQPLVNLKTGEMLGAEGLMRWEHPTFGLIPPPLIFERAEASGQIDQLTEWSIEAMCREWADLRRRWPLFRDKALSINMTARQLKWSRYADVHHEIVARHGLRPVDVFVEVVESGVIDVHSDAEATIKALAERGTIVALDDFGVGYNSLAYFTRMPIRAFKVDRSLIAAGTKDATAHILLSSVFDLAQNLNVYLVGEGIESEAERSLCLEIGIVVGQGNLMCKPMKMPDLERAMEKDWLAWQARKGLVRGPSNSHDD